MSNDADTISEPETDQFDLDSVLQETLRGATPAINTHLLCLKRDIAVEDTKTLLHCYFLPLDGNGRVRWKPLADFLRNQIIDYAIPRRTIRAAYDQAQATSSMASISALHERARRLFTHLAKSGEGGELLLFAMAESIFGITQIICKMALKTSTSMHYHGSDGVYAEARDDGGLNLYWGESKVYRDPAPAIRNCLASLAPFLRDPEGEDAARSQDIFLINEFANFDDARVVGALKRFLDPDDPASLQVTNCGFALSAFDSASYPSADSEATADELAEAITSELEGWTGAAGGRITSETLENFHIHLICVPMPSADAFREYFLKLLGLKNDD